MTVSIEYIPVTAIEYPDEDGKPIAESDQARFYLRYGTEVLEVYFQNLPNVYVSGNLFIYYEQGNPEAVVAPDVFVVFGVENHQRRSYKTWEENNKSPDFVLEITSKATRSKDQGAKKGIYAFLGVREYFQYDPTGDYLTPQLQGLRLVEGNYFPIASNILEDGTVSLTSEVLGLELRVKSGDMRFYDAATGRTLLTYEEQAAARQAAEEKAQKLAAKLRELNIDPDAL
jgi:Uma2 family endonuclease